MAMKSEEFGTEQIWNLLGEKLRLFFLKRVSDEQVAEDLRQETFIRIHKHLGAVEDEDRLTGWVFRIARNLLVDHYRAKGRSDTMDIPAHLPAADKDEENLNELVISWLPMMMAQLPEPYREAVELFELEGLPQQEIADRLGISLSGAKSRIQRGRQKLQELLFECCSFETDARGNVIGYVSKCEENGGACESSCGEAP